jgi:hypothetical protein
MATEVVHIDEAPDALPAEVDLLVVGGPTHAFGLSRPATREGAAKQAAGNPTTQNPATPGRGLREWLAGLQRPASPVAAATFDTRIKKLLVPGSAARGAAKRLRRLGLRMVAKPESFWVNGTAGPLRDGETDRARRWGEHLATQAAALLPATRGGTRS